MQRVICNCIDNIIMHKQQGSIIRVQRYCSTLTSSSMKHDTRYVNVKNAPLDFDISSAVVYPNFVTEEEGKSLINESAKRLKRRRFEDGHWDSVITGYREVELSTPNEHELNQDTHKDVPQFAKAIHKTRKQLADNHFNKSNNNHIQWLPCHAIDLSAKGVLKAHVDSVKFSGEIVAGISLLSDAVMRLRLSSDEWDSDDTKDDTNSDSSMNSSNTNEEYVDLYLPQNSLYVLTGMSRYSYTHELLPTGSTFELSRSGGEGDDDDTEIEVIRGRRLSIIFRDAKKGKDNSS